MAVLRLREEFYHVRGLPDAYLHDRAEGDPMRPAMFMLRVHCRGSRFWRWRCAWRAAPVPAMPAAASRFSRPSSASSATASTARAAHRARPGAKRVDRDFTPAVMASLMWNHAPDMWAAMKKQGIVKGQMTPEAAADLFAYFVSARYFEKPGDAGRGKQAFAAKHCAECHGHHHVPRSRRAAGGQMGIAGRSHRAGAADVEPRRQDARGSSPKRSLPGRSSPARN